MTEQEVNDFFAGVDLPFTSYYKKVVPFTIAIQFTDMGTTYHYLADSTEGYKIGDFAVVAGYNGNAFQLARVVDVDTKSESATKHFQPLKRL